MSVIVGGVKIFRFAGFCVGFKRLMRMNVNTLVLSGNYLCQRLKYTEITGYALIKSPHGSIELC